MGKEFVHLACSAKVGCVVQKDAAAEPLFQDSLQVEAAFLELLQEEAGADFAQPGVVGFGLEHLVEVPFQDAGHGFLDCCEFADLPSEHFVDLMAASFYLPLEADLNEDMLNLFVQEDRLLQDYQCFSS